MHFGSSDEGARIFAFPSQDELGAGRVWESCVSVFWNFDGLRKVQKWLVSVNACSATIVGFQTCVAAGEVYAGDMPHASYSMMTQPGHNRFASLEVEPLHEEP